MKQEVIIAGFGGQGVMLLGQLLANAGMYEGENVSWMPSYGPEMRGGTANCHVIVSSEPVASPYIVEPDTAIVMSLPSMEKFAPQVKKGGLLLINSTLIEKDPGRSDLDILKVPANKIANELGNTRIANMVALGAFVGRTGTVKMETIIEAMEKTLPKRHQDFIPLNTEALKRGAELA